MGERRLHRIGLTGSIATGKSTAARLLREMGYMVLDADQIYHQLIERSSSLSQAIANAFGQEILDPKTGGVDRRALGSLVFHDQEALKRLNAITHPAVFNALSKEADQREHIWAESARESSLLFFDVPLLIEARELAVPLHLNGIWLITADPEIQLKRLMEREQLDQNLAMERIRAHAPQEEKEKFATLVIPNNRDEETLRHVLCSAAAEEINHGIRQDIF